VYNSPLLDLVYAAAGVHRMHNDPSMVRASPRARRRRAQGYFAEYNVLTQYLAPNALHVL